MEKPHHEIAIIGMAGRFPGAANLDEFWANLLAGKDSISRFSEAELAASDYALSEVVDDPGFVPARGVLDGIDQFDAQFFGFRPREAASLDPQQRVWFECAWEALEHAGISPAKSRDRIGVFAGGGYLNTYLMLNLCKDRDAVERLVRLRAVDAFQNIINNDKDFLPTRTSHLFGLTGPSVNVQTACSTSLVAVIMGAQSLLLGESDVCLAGGISIQLPQVRGYLSQEGGMDSFDGVVRPFDAKANGTVFGNGVGAVVLKRLSDARRDGDQVLAVLRGYALNNDGARRASYVAPSIEGQQDVIRRALDMAGGDAGRISYVEAHGTGTSTGDPIEVEALASVFSESTEQRGFCGIGSVKSNVGHLDSAAGVVGLIKVLLALQHGEIPPSIHFDEPNPLIDFPRSPFYVVRKRTPWSRAEAPRMAAVSSFGVGGTNAHVILQEAPEPPAQAAAEEPGSWELLAVSAKSEAALDARCSDLASFLETKEVPLAGVASSLMNRRDDMPFRRFLVAECPSDAAAALRQADATRLISGRLTKHRADVVFMFPGQGSQSIGMARDIYGSEPIFRDTIDECSALFAAHLETRLSDLLYPDPGVDPREAQEALKQTRVAQPAIFAVELALARLWMSWGVEPAKLIGHSLGDFAAACLAGVFTLEGAAAALAARSALMQACEPGSMLAVQGSSESIASLLAGAEQVQLAAVNGPRLCVVAGPAAAIDAFASTCSERGIETRALHTSHAFHSEMMQPAVAPFRQALSRIPLSASTIPIVSSRTGRLLTDSEAKDPDFWASQILDPVLFHQGIRSLNPETGHLFLEVGPGTALASFARQAGAAKAGAVISTLGPATDERPDRVQLLEAVGRLWVAGGWPERSPLFDASRAAVPLPTYPFQRQRYWVDAPTDVASVDVSELSQSFVSTNSTEPVMPQSPTSAPSRLPKIRTALAEIFEEYSGLDVGAEDPEMTFLEMGFDSLFLTQITTALQNQFGTRFKFRRMLEDLCTLDRLAEFFDGELPPEQFADPVPVQDTTAVPGTQAAQTPSPAQPATIPAAMAAAPVVMQPMPIQPDSVMPGTHAIVQQQLAIMQSQLALLGGVATASFASPPTQALPTEVATPEPRGAAAAAPEPAAADVQAEDAPKKPKAFGAQARISTEETDEFTPTQRACFDAFVERYVAKTGGSKTFTQKYRQVMSDPRVVTGFRPLWKELVYPIVVDRSKGSRLWDLDGNEYVDLTCGFGSNFLGNQPDFLADAVREQIDRGYEVGPQHPLTAEVSLLISELTGMERVAFCNTGSEAVMGAMRAARTITGRSLVAIFANSYHGIFDEVIVRGTKKLRSIAAAPGILASAVENVLVLEYGSPESLEILKARGDELAAILTEPVQSRNPSLQPREFLHELRSIADGCGAALIFDEVITGFRISPGGAQEYFGVRADLATYGKIIGGGLPFAAIAGGPRFMDALDGGHWEFGDDSYPEVGVTYFAGTFVRHPLALAAAKASLVHLKEQGPELQRRLNERTTGFVSDLRALFDRKGAQIRIEQFGSLCRLTVSEEEPFGALLYYWLRDHGVHIWEGFGTFLTASHTDEDVQHLLHAFETSISELQDGQLLSGSVGVSASSRAPEVHAAASAGVDGEPSGFPLTEAQQEIWHAAQMGPEASCAYNECFTLHIDGELDERAFREAVDLVSLRHEALSLRFDAEGGHQYRVAAEAPELPVLNLGDLSEEAIEEALAAVLERHATETFDLEAGPLIRNELYRLGDTRWVFVSTAHHIVFDGWSAGVYIDEIGQAYSRLKAGERPDLPSAPGFIDFVRKEIEESHSEAGRKASTYWAEVFRVPPRPLELPTDRQRPVRRSFEGRSLHWAFSEDVYQAARRAAARNKTTLYSLLLTAFGAYLNRLTGQDDLVVGIPTAGQATVGEYSLIGHCVSILPVRLAIASDQPFLESLSETARRVLDAQEHQPATLGGILRNAPIQRIPGRSPLVEVVFNLNRKLPEESFEGLATRISEVQKRSLNWDMFLNCSEEDGRLTTDLDYNTDLFDEDTIRSFLQGFEHLLGVVSADVGRAVSGLPIMSEEAEARLVGLGRGEEVRNAADTVLDLFSAWVARDPGRTAVRWGDASRSYGDLADGVHAVAAALRARGVGSGSGVGVCLSRTVDLPAALLGVMSAGAYYIPLDPTNPASRNEHILRDSAVGLVIVDATTPDLLSGGAATVVTLAELLESPAESSTHLEPPAGKSPAYRIYTSGSTGRPKGVEVSHGALLNFLESMRRTPGFGAEDVLLSVTTISFDIAGLELFLPLVAGGTTLIAPDEVKEDPAALLGCLRSEGVTVLQATPTHWRVMVESGLEKAAGLRALVGGEALPISLAEDLLARCDEVWNMYGPTETTIWSTCRRLDSSDLESGVSIGRPIANTSCYIMDAQRRLVPMGSVGELWIGGDGVAEGYPTQPELTQERFVPDPFRPGARMYNTGDVCRWLPDGNLTYLHRVDEQIKVRGFRIEPGEVEGALRLHAGVRDAVVRRWEPSPGDVRLVGYVVSERAPAPSAGELRNFLGDQLPDYMIPQHIVEIDAVPHTTNGKIDRGALPDPAHTAQSTEVSDDGSAGEVQRAVQAVWRDVLGTDRVGLHDDFFDLGGHSVLAARVVTRLRRELEPGLAFRHLFDAPTVFQLAAEIEGLRFAREGAASAGDPGEEMVL